MPLWQRLLLTLLAMLLISFLAGLLWNAVFGSLIPSYLAGVAGGIGALPVWEVSKRIRISGKD